MAEYAITVDQLVVQFLPVGFSVSQGFLDNSVKTWQLMLWENFIGNGVTDETKFDIQSYPDKAKPLFASLVVYDALERALSASYLDVLGDAGSTEGAEAGGNVKKITTGPTDVEFHDGASALAKLIAASKFPGGILAELASKACFYASALGISLPFCQRKKKSVPMVKGGTRVYDLENRFLKPPYNEKNTLG